jgi:hypothetical protein
MKALLLLAAGVLALAGCASLMAAAHRESGPSEVRKFRMEIGKNVLAMGCFELLGGECRPRSRVEAGEGRCFHMMSPLLSLDISPLSQLLAHGKAMGKAGSDVFSARQGAQVTHPPPSTPAAILGTTLSPSACSPTQSADGAMHLDHSSAHCSKERSPATGAS